LLTSLEKNGPEANSLEEFGGIEEAGVETAEGRALEVLLETSDVLRCSPPIVESEKEESMKTLSSGLACLRLSKSWLVSAELWRL